MEEGIRSNKLNCMFSGFSFKTNPVFFLSLTSDRKGLFVLLLLISSFCQRVTATCFLHVFIICYVIDITIIICDYLQLV